MPAQPASVSAVGSGVNLGEVPPKEACSRWPPLPAGIVPLTLSVVAFAQIIARKRFLSNRGAGLFGWNAVPIWQRPSSCFATTIRCAESFPRRSTKPAGICPTERRSASSACIVAAPRSELQPARAEWLTHEAIGAIIHPATDRRGTACGQARR